ncbi:hypothetical protein OAG66_01290, partial [bacterium]|nr:hypothetical protein [bacterium]
MLFSEILRFPDVRLQVIKLLNLFPLCVARMPNAQGFDYYFGTLGANDGGTVAFHENNQAAGKTSDMASLTRLYTDKAIDFLKNKRDKGKPFV